MDARRHDAALPRWWVRQAACIHHYETRGYRDPAAWHLVNPPYAGGLQFTLGTWNEAGTDYRTLADVGAATPQEQMRRAWIIWRKRGGRWGRDWPNTSRACGLR